jgi:hypothetical protein
VNESSDRGEMGWGGMRRGKARHVWAARKDQKLLDGTTPRES